MSFDYNKYNEELKNILGEAFYQNYFQIAEGCKGAEDLSSVEISVVSFFEDDDIPEDVLDELEDFVDSIDIPCDFLINNMTAEYGNEYRFNNEMGF